MKLLCLEIIIKKIKKQTNKNTKLKKPTKLKKKIPKQTVPTKSNNPPIPPGR